MRALVTGGAGFIGSHIVDELLRRDAEVIVVDDFSSGRIDNLAAHSRDRRLRIVTGNIAEVSSLLRDVDDIDVVFHEAAIASVPKSIEDPWHVHDVNVNATIRLLDFCVEKDVGRLIFASSAAVYGALGDKAADERFHCVPSSPYGASKMSSECYLGAYYRTYGVKTVSLRYFNVYGPRQALNDYSGVITIFATRLLREETPLVYGDGAQSRDFVSVRDVVRANMLAMESDSAVGDVFNIASGSSTTILELFYLLREFTTSENLEPDFAPPRAGDVLWGKASIAKARAKLGYEPEVALREGLHDLVQHLAATENVGVLALGPK